MASINYPDYRLLATIREPMLKDVACTMALCGYSMLIGCATDDSSRVLLPLEDEDDTVAYLCLAEQGAPTNGPGEPSIIATCYLLDAHIRSEELRRALLQGLFRLRKAGAVHGRFDLEQHGRHVEIGYRAQLPLRLLRTYTSAERLVAIQKMYADAQAVYEACTQVLAPPVCPPSMALH